jgi:DNA-binding CsgD family transcriptional regulator
VGYRPGVDRPGERLIGRDIEFSRLTQALDELGSRGTAVAVIGEPGIGKTALLAAVADSAAARGMATVRATGTPSEASLPFSGLGQLLQAAPRAIEQLPASQRTAILGALGKIDVDVGDFFAVALATLSLLRDRAADAPLVIIAEDIQWLDNATVDVLGFVMRRIALDPILILISSRSAVLSGLDGTALERLELDGIDVGDAGALVDMHAPTLRPDLKERLLQAAGGNPLALVELAVAWSRLAPEALIEPWVPVTSRIEDAFATRLRALPARCRTVLLVAALSDAHDVAEVLAAASVVEDGPVGHAELSLAIEAGLVMLDDRSMRFRHPLVRSVIYQAASLSARHVAHMALAQVIDEERAIWHRAAAALVPDENIAAGLERAADLARRRGTITVAVTTLERAADLSPGSAERGRRLLDASQLAVRAAKPDVAEQLLVRAEGLDLSPVDRARAAWGLQQLRGGIWNDRDVLRIALGTIEAISEAGDAERALDALVALCEAGNLAFDRDLVLATAERLPAAEDDPRLIYIVAFAAPVERNSTLIEQVARARLRPTAGTDGEVLRLLGTAATIRGAPQLGLSLLGRSVEALRAQGRLSALKSSLVSRASAAFTAGAWDQTIQFASEATAIAEQTEAYELGAAFLLAVIAAVRGDLDVLQTAGVPIEQWARANGARTMLVLALAIRGHSDLASGRWDEAYECFRSMIGAQASHDLAWAHAFLVSLSEAAAQSGHAAEARELLDRAHAMPGSASPVLVASVLYGRALLAKGPDAETAFHTALSHTPEGSPFDRGRLLLFHGMWLRRQRRPSEARTSLRAARDIFDALRAAPWADRARQQLRASGERSPQVSPQPAEQLTPQEAEIARLAAQGLTNREIGQRLFLSHRTVGAHLYRIFPKLGITSRRELQALFLLEAPASAVE